jgi:hypothetical protein
VWVCECLLRRSGDRPRGRPPSLRVTGRVHGCHGLCEALGREKMLPGWLWASARVRKLLPPVCCSTAARRPDACNPTRQNRCACYVASPRGGARLRAAPGGRGGCVRACHARWHPEHAAKGSLARRAASYESHDTSWVGCMRGWSRGAHLDNLPHPAHYNWRRDSVPKRSATSRVKHIPSRCA